MAGTVTDTVFARDVMVTLFLAGYRTARRGRPVTASDLRPHGPASENTEEVFGALREMAWRRKRRFPSSPEPAWDDSVPAALAAMKTATAEPYAPLVDTLDLTGGLEGRVNVIERLFHRAVQRGMRRSGPHGVVLRALAEEAVRLAVRAGHPSVTTAHGLLAILALDDQFAATGRRLAERFRPGNDGGEVLRRHGVTPRVVHDPEEPVGESVFPEAVAGPPWSAALSAAFEVTGGEAAGSGDLLEALLTTDGAAARLVRSAGADPADLIRDVRRRRPGAPTG